MLLPCRASEAVSDSLKRGNSLSRESSEFPSSPAAMTMNLHVGVLHYDPSFEPFPLLMDPVEYEPNTLNIREDKPMLHYWLNVLQDSIQTIMAKAMASEGATTGMSAAPLGMP